MRTHHHARERLCAPSRQGRTKKCVNLNGTENVGYLVAVYHAARRGVEIDFSLISSRWSVTVEVLHDGLHYVYFKVENMKKEFFYPSKDGRTQIHAIAWIPEGALRGILQLYEDTQAKFSLLPYFILGHSMGSFLVRQFIEKYSVKLAGAIMMGTGWQSAATLDMAIGMTAALQQLHGGHYRSSTINGLAPGSCNKAFEPARTKNDWLTRDEAIVDAYEQNPLSQFMFTVNGYYNMFRGMRYAIRQENLNKIPKDLPIRIVSGQADPVGDFGKGPKKLADVYREAGIRDVTLKLYPEDRHELLNELDRESVDADLLAWMKKHMP